MRNARTLPEPVIVVDYDPSWPRRFAREREDILRACGGSAFEAIEHVGSTSVPGLAAKPIIDMMGGVRSLVGADGLVGPLARIGYGYVPEYEWRGPSGGIPERRYFRKVEDGEERAHLHVVETDSAFWQGHLLFRDHLRRHPKAARAYERLKRKLADEHRTDRAGYTAAKRRFIEAVEVEARQEAT